MALFFDSKWFDARIEALGLSRGDIANALGISAEQLAEMWKDQRELFANDVRILSALLAIGPEEIARRAGISTPVPRNEDTVLERLDRIERELAEIKAQLRAQK
jgi:transcriptional regulator with XRE-family HTH domain